MIAREESRRIPRLNFILLAPRCSELSRTEINNPPNPRRRARSLYSSAAPVAGKRQPPLHPPLIPPRIFESRHHPCDRRWGWGGAPAYDTLEQQCSLDTTFYRLCVIWCLVWPMHVRSRPVLGMGARTRRHLCRTAGATNLSRDLPKLRFRQFALGVSSPSFTTVGRVINSFVPTILIPPPFSIPPVATVYELMVESRR